MSSSSSSTKDDEEWMISAMEEVDWGRLQER